MSETVNLIHFDFHNPIGIKNFAKNFDEKKFAKALKKACVTEINFFAECNNGYCYFPTKVGEIYPTLKKDLFGNVLKECHKQNVKVNAYVHLGLNHVQALKHADWTKDQRVGAERYVEDCDKADGMRFTNFMCYNSDGYKNYVKELLKEILVYDIDGVFFDGFYPEECYCPVCNAIMHQENVDTGNPKEVIDFQTRKMLEFAKELKQLIPESLTVIFNGFPPEYHLNTRYEYEGNFADYYKTSYLRNIYADGVFTCGRFLKGWGDFGGIKPKTEFESDLYDSLLGSSILAFGDHLHPVNGANYELLREIGNVFEKRSTYAKYLSNQRPVAEIAILCNTFADVTLDAYKGTIELAEETHLTYDIINPTSRLDKYSLIILPDGLTLTETACQRLDKYFENGGKILSCGFTALGGNATLLKSHAFISEVVNDENTRAYFKLSKPFENYKNTAFQAYFPAVKIKGRGKKLATYVDPLFEKNTQDVSGVFYNAQGEESKYATALVYENCAHVGFELFKAYAKHHSPAHKELFKQLIDCLLPDSLIKSDLPSFVKTSLTQSEAFTLLHVKTTCPVYKNGAPIIEEHAVLKEGFKICVKGEYEATSCPDEKRIRTKYRNGYTQLILPEITGYLMIKLIKGE